MLAKISKIALKIALGVIVVTVASGATYQFVQARNDRLAFPTPGIIYDVDGIDLHLDCRGEGSPTVVMEAGLTSGSNSWLQVWQGISETTRFCAYDRPGIDWSEAIGRTADSKEISDRLHRLLEIAEINDDKILIGMSAGGVYVREYYHNHPEGIVGMVLIDSSHEQQANRLPANDGDDAFQTFLNFCRFLQPLGLIRAMGSLETFIDQVGIEGEGKQSWLANLNQSSSCSSIYWEMQSFNEEVKDELPPKSLGDLPLIVLSQGIEPEAIPEAGISKEQAIEERQIWNELQLELTGLSTNGRRFLAMDSGHVIQFDQPELVIEKISQLALRQRVSSK